jgi:hypothetical protein
MDTINHTLLIAQLKRKPRHGITPLDAASAGAEGSAGAAGIYSLSAAYAQLLDQQSLTVRGLEAFVGIQEKLNDAFATNVKSTLYLELRNKELNKSFGIGSIAAAKFGSKLQTIASELKITGIQAQQYAINIKKMLPTLNQMATKDASRYKGLVRVQQILTTNLGLSEKEAEDYSYFATQRGKDANQTLASQHALSKAIEDSTGLQGSFQLISQGIAETSADVQLQYGKMPGNLELAILKAKALGFSMADLKSTANNLLNIESSIGQELEYQLLSGRRLVDTKGKSLTNAYREAALQGNANKQADTLNTILEQEGETLSNNLFARQQMSQLLGMDEAALARALQKKSILEKIGGGELFTLTGNALMDAAKGLQGVTDADIAAIAEAEDTRTTDEKMLQEMEMLTDVMIKALIPSQATAVAGARKAAMLGTKEVGFDTTKIGTPEFLGAGKAAQAGVSALGSTREFGAQLLTAKSMVVQSMSVAKGAAVPTATGDDMLSPPSGYGSRTLIGPEGAIQLNNKDTIIAGTNLFDKSSSGNDSTNARATVPAKSSVDNVELSNTMLQVGAMIVAAIKSSGINLNERYSA